MQVGMRAAGGLVIGLALGLGGCATILSGTADAIRFESRPTGAEVLIDGVSAGHTPLTTDVGRSLFGRDVTLRLPGYRPRTFALSRGLDGIVLGNLLCLWGVVLCAGVDVVTGAIMAYDSTRYEIELRPIPDRTAAPAAAPRYPPGGPVEP